MRGIFLLSLALVKFSWAEPLMRKSPLLSRSRVQLEAFTLDLPPGWILHQEFKDNGKKVWGFSKNEEYVRWVTLPDGRTHLRDLFSNEVKFIDDGLSENRAGLSWKMILASRTLPESVGEIRFLV